METLNFENNLDKLVSLLADYSIVLAAIATFVMAIVELIKAVFKIRRTYNRIFLQRWADRRSIKIDLHFINQWIRSLYTIPRHPNPIYSDLLELTVGKNSSENALFEQPIEKMMGMIQSSLNLCIENPKVSINLYQFISDFYDRRSEKNYIYDSLGDNSDAEKWLRFTLEVESKSIEEMSPEYIKNATKAKANIEHMVNRKMDSFQIMLEYNWARINQFTAFVISVSLIIFLTPSGNVIHRLFLGLVGGAIAPFAKDLYTALIGLKKKA